jgi:hypothetical protein
MKNPGAPAVKREAEEDWGKYDGAFNGTHHCYAMAVEGKREAAMAAFAKSWQRVWP